jgi:hypothetical protein
MSRHVAFLVLLCRLYGSTADTAYISARGDALLRAEDTQVYPSETASVASANGTLSHEGSATIRRHEVQQTEAPSGEQFNSSSVGLSSKSEFNETKPSELIRHHTLSDAGQLKARQTMPSDQALLEKSVVSKGPPPKVNGKWGAWGPWATCSKTCGGGKRTRHRKKSNPAHGGSPATGPSSDTGDCNTKPCAVDCKWQAWAKWADCSKTCGGGKAKRERKMSQAMHGGKVCDGDNEEEKECKVNACPTTTTTTTTKATTPAPPKAGAAKVAVRHTMMALLLVAAIAGQ